MGLVTFAAILAVLLLPDTAWAWGPLAHVWYGTQALQDLTSASVALQRLLAQHPLHYLYGCLAPDIIHVKSYTASVYTHCHGWPVGWRLLREAKTEEERAFGWGYLSHLTADVYSHNFFVPAQLVASFPSRVRRHLYWEARFDAQFGPEPRRRLTELRDRGFPRCDALVERVVERTLFSFRTNRRIFQVVLGVQQLDSWQRTLRRLTRTSRFALSEAEIDRYRRLGVDAIRDLLAHEEDALALRHDPTGRATIDQAKDIRRKLRALRRRGMPLEQLRRQVVDQLSDASGSVPPS